MASLQTLQALKAAIHMANFLREFMCVKPKRTAIKAWGIALYFPTFVRKNHR